MMSLSRYLCAVVVLVVASLTPSSCSDVAEQAMAQEDNAAVAADEIVIERGQDGVQVHFATDTDANETGS